METKKTERADLEKRRPIFGEVALAFVLVCTLGAFEYSVRDQTVRLFDEAQTVDVIDELPPITMPVEQQTPPPPPPPPAVELITIVDDDEELPNDFEFLSTEATQEDAVIEYQTIDVVEPDDDEPVDIFIAAEQMPEFPGGTGALMRYIAQSIKYPPMAIDNGIQGKVFVKFVVEADGSVSNVEVARPYDPSLDKEAVRVVKSMPKWSPGKQRGRPVRVAYTMPINFVLQ
ncbi:MAG: energy transducer TonB [Bacteroidales bacterium]|nr:energy transducer TonB [Bacteroidales bacterium]